MNNKKSERLSPSFAVFNQHINEAGTQAKSIFIKQFGLKCWNDVMQPLEDAGIMTLFNQTPTFHTSFYATTITLLVNGDLVVSNE